MIHLGDIPASTTLYVPFTSTGADGASITISGLAVTDIEIYKNGSTTQRASDNGYALLDTDGIDFDGITGIHGISVDLSDNSDASFYTVGAFYWIVVSTVTVDSKTVSFVAATFRIRAAEATAGYPVSTVKVGTGTGELDIDAGIVRAVKHDERFLEKAGSGGSDSNSGKFPSIPKLTLSAAGSVVPIGGIINVGVGTWTEANDFLTAQKSLNIIGRGRDLSIITNSATTLRLYHNSKIQSCYVNCTTTSGAGTQTGIEATGMNGIWVDDCKVQGYYDAVEVASGNYGRITRSELRGYFDGLNFSAQQGFEISDSYLFTAGDYQNGSQESRAIFAGGDTVHGIIRNCRVEAWRSVTSIHNTTALVAGADIALENVQLVAYVFGGSNTSRAVGIDNGASVESATQLRGVRFETYNEGSGGVRDYVASMATTKVYDFGSNLDTAKVDVASVIRAGVDWARVINKDFTNVFNNTTIGTVTSGGGLTAAQQTQLNKIEKLVQS